MKIELTAAHVRRLATQLYKGDSSPISTVAEGREPLEIEWWTSNPQVESPNSDRQRSALQLYLEVGRAAVPKLAEGSFPAVMDCLGETLRPDKAIIKVFLNEKLVMPRHWGAQLIFDLTDLGRSYAA